MTVSGQVRARGTGWLSFMGPDQTDTSTSGHTVVSKLVGTIVKSWSLRPRQLPQVDGTSRPCKAGTQG